MNQQPATSNQEPATSHQEPATANKSPERQTKLIIVLGYNGTGKTTLVKKLVLDSLKRRDRALIVTPDDIEWQPVPLVHNKFKHRIERYVGARRLIYQKGDLELIASHYKSGLLVLDDCRAYLEARTEPEMHELLIRRRQRMIDIIAVGHGFTEVPPKFFTFSSEIILFRTIDNIERRKNVLKDYERMKEAQTRVNLAAVKNPYHYEIIQQ